MRLSVICPPADPSKYRYSPERLKKATSGQSDELPRDAWHGRRQSGNHITWIIYQGVLFLLICNIWLCFLCRANQTKPEEQPRYDLSFDFSLITHVINEGLQQTVIKHGE